MKKGVQFFLFLPEKSVNEKIDRITTKNIATKFGVLVRVVQRSSGRNEERSAVFFGLTGEYSSEWES